MAKKKELPINKIPLNNKLHVATCQTCKGKPTITPINLPDFTGEKCEECYHVISHQKRK